MSKRYDLEYTNRTWNVMMKWHYMYSSVTGQKVADIVNEGEAGTTYIYAGGGNEVAQRYSGDGDVQFKSTDPVTGSTRQTNADGEFSGNEEQTRHEIAGLGTYVPHNQIYAPPPPSYIEGASATNPENGCEFDGMPLPCTVSAMVAAYADSHSVMYPDKKPTYAPDVIYAGGMFTPPRATGWDWGKPVYIGTAHRGLNDPFNDEFVFADNVNYKQNQKGLQKVPLFDDREFVASEWVVSGGNCDLQLPTFDQLGTVNYGGSAALRLLNSTYGNRARLEYTYNMTPVQQAVFLNTVEAVTAQGVNLTNARFVGFYSGDKLNRDPFGVYVSGLTVRDLDNGGLQERYYDGFSFGRRPDEKVREGSVEATIEENSDVAFDVDLNNPYSAAFLAHLVEAGKNHLNKKSTDPIDAMRRLNHRGVFTGVRCVPR